MWRKKRIAGRVNRKLGLMGVVILTLFISQARAATLHSAFYDWYTLQSEHFYVHYHEGLEDIARDTLSLAEAIHKRLSKIIDWQPSSRTHVVLTDEYDISNGFATPFPNKHTTIFITPPDDLISLEDHAGWIETVLTHEYTHVLHLDKADGTPKGLRNVFGRNPFFAFPNLFQPRWLIEGYATYIETDRKRGIGRGQSSLYEGMMRAELLGGFKPVNQVSQPMATWPSGTAAYLYGVFWHEFIEQTYGRELVEMSITHNSNNLLPFAINRTALSTYGKGLYALWDDYEQYLWKKFQPQIDSIRKQGVIEGTRLTHDGYFAGPISSLSNGEAYYIAYNGEREPSLIKIDKDKNVDRLTDVPMYSRLDVHPSAGILMSQFEICGAGEMYADLYHYDLDGGGRNRLTSCGRYRNAVWSPDGKQILAVKYALGVTELHLLDEWGNLKEVLWKGKRWDVIGGLDWSPLKNEVIAAVYREQGGWNLEKFNLGTRQWQYVLRDSAIVGFPKYTDDGRYVLFTSEHGGVYNIRRLDTRTGQFETLTNVLTGAIAPSQTPNGDLFYVGYTNEGMDVYYLASSQMKPTALPKAAKGTTGQPLPTPPRVEPQAVTEYSPWDTLTPSWWFPVSYVDTDRSSFGAQTLAVDSLFQHMYSVIAAYDFSNDWLEGQLFYGYDALYPTFTYDVLQEHEFEYRDNANGDPEKKRVRRTTDHKLEMIVPFRGVSSGWTFNLAAMKREEKDIFTATGETPDVSKVDNVAGAALLYDSTNRHIKSVSRSQGRMISLVAEDSDEISGSDYAGQVNWLDWREFVRLGGEHVFALRYVEGKGESSTRPFKLGGSKNNNRLANSVKDPIYGSPFRKRNYNLRGYREGLPQLEGQNMRMASAEYRFPISRIERGALIPLIPVGIDQIHASVFYDIGATWDEGSEPEKYYRGYGFEVNMDVALFYFGVGTVSFGFAKGIDEGGEELVYARAGASF